MPTKKTAIAAQLPIPVQLIERRIYLIRDQKVMLDNDLAELYQVETFNLNKAVKRNLSRFPEDFMFQLAAPEWDALIFQTGISNTGRGGRRHAPFVFTEQGVAMLSSVLNSERAVQVNIAIMRAFVKLREVLATHKDLTVEMDKLKHEQQKQGHQIQQVFAIIEKLLAPPPESPKRPIGFRDRSQD